VKVGDQVVITEDRRTSGRNRRPVIRKGRVVQVLPRYAVVHNGLYRECVWLDNDRGNRTVIEGKSK